MKNTILAMCALCAVSALALEADYTEGERSADLISPAVSAAVCQLLGNEQASNLLHAVKLNMTVYDTDMTTQAGRVRWHGRQIHEAMDTNTCEIVRTYSNHVNGAVWRYRQRCKVKRPPTVESRIVAVDRAKKRAEAAERRRQARIAAITTNEAAEVAALMRKNGYPADLASLMLKWELSQLSATNTVNTVVTPQ